MSALGGVQPALRHVACTSAPRWYLKLSDVTRTLGMVILVPSGGCHLFILNPLKKLESCRQDWNRQQTSHPL